MTPEKRMLEKQRENIADAVLRRLQIAVGLLVMSYFAWQFAHGRHGGYIGFTILGVGVAISVARETARRSRGHQPPRGP
jgi:hypothetical protein